jgi:DNA polymerase-1
VPALEEVQTSCSAEVVQRWVHYSVLDAVSTWELYHLLRAQLIQMPLYTPGVGGVPSVASAGARGGSSSKDATEVMWERTAAPQRVPTMLDLYHSLIVPFSETLINMERRGVCVDREWLLQQSKLAERDCQAAKERFRACLVEGGYVAEEDSGCVLLSSSAQMAHLLFSETGETREFKVENPLYGQPLPPEQQPLSSLPPPSQAKDGVGENDDEDADGGGNASKTKPSQRKKAAPISPKLKMHKKQKVLVLSGMGLGRLSSRRTASGNLSVASTVMDALVKRPVGDFVVGGTEGPRQSQLRLEALEALQEARSIQTMINTFFTNLEAVIQPPHDRVHASLNLNTTTGRLSCQRPNLQNQPALGKDRYRIRQAFVPKEGCKFIVADYSQLELRILAHIAHDQAMLTAFELGGDFHSRTAMSMYDYVAEAVKNGEVRLETGDGGGTEAEEAAVTVPLLKDVFASERSKAKILNFSIAYGKTAYGLAKDFGVSTEDAQATVDSWYAGRPSVKRWQDHTISQGECVDVLHVKTLLGRRRQLTNLRLPRRMKEYKAATRAAINTPIQGSAADIMMMAMIAIEQNARLRELGWDLLLQIHDEVILEGPEESAEEALGIVRDAMMHPISLHPAVAEAAGGGSQRILQVDLVVDAKIGDSWYEAK